MRIRHPRRYPSICFQSLHAHVRSRRKALHRSCANARLCPGVIELALQLAPQTLSREHLICVERPLKHVLPPFPEDDAVSDHSIEGVESAFRMDFENYTLGRLVEGRSNYD